MNRRQFVAGALAAPLITPGPAGAAEPIFIGDMHFHLFFFGRKPAAVQPLARNMASGQATLVSWSLVGDVPWLRPKPGGFAQNGTPQPGQAVSWFSDELSRVKQHIADEQLKVVATARDVERALSGVPHIVLSVEGATFADRGVDEIRVAHQLGVRHIQLVHFIRNSIGDIQTSKPEYKGLTAFGEDVVRECNRQGILVDLAHCTEDVVMRALEVSKLPVVWSHSSVQPQGMSRPPIGWQARQLTATAAKAIAKGGGVVGLWALGADIGGTTQAYAKRVSELAEWLGEDHVAFGTDMNALANPALSTFADLRQVVNAMKVQGVPDLRIRKVAIENYARVLASAMDGATT
jgi:membrane dipeptidase